MTFNLAGFCLADNALRRPVKTALILTDGTIETRLSYEEFDLAVRGLAAGLSSLGLRAGRPGHDPPRQRPHYTF